MPYSQDQIDRLADAITEFAKEVNGASHRQVWAADQAAKRFAGYSKPPKNLVLAWAQETREFVLNGSNWRFVYVVDAIIKRETTVAA